MPTHFREQLTLHAFTLILDGLVVADETTLDALYEAGASDALFGQRDMIQFADFDREAGDLVGAITSAIEQVESVEGIRVLRVEPEDLVSASAIAERTGRTRESVRLLIEGERGPGEFPPPVAWVDAKTRLWHWSDVANWFSDKFDQRVDDVDDAQLIAALNASLETRNRLATLERTEHRVAVAHIVADSRPFAVAARDRAGQR